MSTEEPNRVVNLDEVPPFERLVGEHWGGVFKVLTPAMRPGS